MAIEQPDKRKGAQPSDMGSKDVTRLVAAGVVAALMVIFIVQNTEKAQVDFLFFDFRAGLWLVLTITFVLGAAVGYLVPKARRRKAEKAAKGGKPTAK